MIEANPGHKLILSEIKPPKDLWRNRFDEQGQPTTELTQRFGRVSALVQDQLPGIATKIFLGGSSTDSSLLSGQPQPRDYDWIALVQPEQELALSLEEESDLLTASPGINDWMSAKTREVLRFGERKDAAQEIEAHKDDFDDIIVKKDLERGKRCFCFEDRKWYFAT